MRPWWGAVLCAFGCGGSDPLPDSARPIDAPKADAGCVMGCDPVSPTSCSNASQRCTWLVDPQQPRGGVATCLPSGAIPVNVACMRDASGGDNCVKGATCYQDVCRQICDLASPTSVCGTALTCRSTMFFLPCTGSTPAAGLCVP